MPLLDLNPAPDAIYHAGQPLDAFHFGGEQMWVKVVSEGAVPLRTGTSKTATQVFIGHSLVDTLFNFTDYGTNGVYSGLAAAGGVVGAFDKIKRSTIPGSSMEFLWNAASTSPQTVSARHDIANYDLMVITERVPLAGPYSDHIYTEADLQSSVTYLKQWASHARTNGRGGAGAEVLFYTTWPNIDGQDGPFRTRLDQDEIGWHYIQERANADLGGYIHIIPCHRLMMRIYDDIQLGNVPGITALSQLFLDTIHPNAIGGYAVACLHYAVIFGETPVGLPRGFINATPAPTAAQATYFQTIASEIATTYARAGRGGTDMGLEGIRTPPPLEHPSVTLGSRATFILAPRDNPIAGRTGTTPAVIGGPVGQVSGLVAPDDARRPTLRDGYISFPGTAMMHGAATASGPCYILQLVRVNSILGAYQNRIATFCQNDVFWNAAFMSLTQNSTQAQVDRSSGMAAPGLAAELGNWWIIERYWGANGGWGRIENREVMTTISSPGQTLLSTSKVQVGGVLDGGSYAGSPVYQYANVDIAGIVRANAEPAETERRSMIHYLRSSLAGAL